MTRKRDEDISGTRYGSLVALRDTGRTDRRSRIWLWRCDCGVEDELSLKVANDERRRKNGCRHVVQVKQPRRDVSGERFGALVALHDVGPVPGGKGRVWRWRCDCGREEEIRLSYITGTVKSWEACSHCRAKRCIVCGTAILHPKGRGQMLCSPECHAERHRTLERQAAARRRADPVQKANRSAYERAWRTANPDLYLAQTRRRNARLKADIAADPDKAVAAREAGRRYSQEWLRRRALRSVMSAGSALEDMIGSETPTGDESDA